MNSDKEAAHLYRLKQAQGILEKTTITIGANKSEPAFSQDRNGRWHPTQAALVVAELVRICKGDGTDA